MPYFLASLGSSRIRPLFRVITLGVLLCGDRAGASPFSNFQKATMVIGQADFTAHSQDINQSIISEAVDVAFSSKGVLAVAQRSGRVVLFNSLPTANGASADVVVGQPNFTAPGFTIINDPQVGSILKMECTASLMSSCFGVAFSPDGTKLIVSDMANNRVLIWNAIPKHNGQAADVVIGQKDFTSHEPRVGATGFDMPTGVMVTPKGQLLVSDYRGGRVLLYNSIPHSNEAAADVVIGQKDFTSGDEYMGFRNGLGASYLRSPMRTALSPDGKLLVCSSGSDAVHIWNSIPTTNGVPADVVIGQPDFSSWATRSAEFPLASKLSQPTGVALSSTGQLAISSNRNRVLIYNRIPTRNGALADVVLGQPDFKSASLGFGETAAKGSPSQLIGDPMGLTFLPDGRLVVSAGRVLFFGDSTTKVKTLQ